MATTEAFALHARVLVEFLWRDPAPGKKRRFKDDASAAATSLKARGRRCGRLERAS